MTKTSQLIAGEAPRSAYATSSDVEPAGWAVAGTHTVIVKDEDARWLVLAWGIYDDVELAQDELRAALERNTLAKETNP